jgi:peptide/nickel transport system substrate-binding protein
LRTKRALLILAVVMASVLAIAGCSANPNSPAGGGSSSSSGGSNDSLVVVTPDTGWTWAVDNGFGGLEPSMNVVGATLVRNPYQATSENGVVAQNVSEYEPYLAKSWTVSKNNRVITFHLANAVSEQGNPLTSDDVIWSWERRFNTATSVSPSIQNPQITSITQFHKIDEKTFTVTLAQPGYLSTFFGLIANVTAYIYDAKYLEAHATPSDPYAVKFTTTHPNYGFGPYSVTNYQPGISATLTANSNFVLGAPKIKTIIYKIVPDEGTRVNLLKSGAADVALDLAPSDLANLAKGPGTATLTVPDPNSYMEMPLLANKAPFNNALVRQAMEYAIPYQQIIQNVFHGLAFRKSPGFLRSDAPGYDGSGFTDFTYDPAKAKALLAQAGISTPVNYTLTVSAAEPDMQEAAVQIQTFAKAAGFNITIKQDPASAFGEGRTNHTFQAFLLEDYSITLTPSYELNVYTAKNPDGSPAGNNLGAWVDPAFYAAKAKADALPNPYTPAAGKLWNAAEQIFINQAPIAFIAQIQPTTAFRTDVKGITWRSDQWIDWSQAYKSAPTG